MNSVSDSFSVTLRRERPSQPWGFRLQGGVNFTTALSIQSVNAGSIAARAGLQAGDAVLQINGRPSDELEHEQAKQEIITSGNKVFLVVQRGAVKIWKPRVTPMSELRPKEMNLRPKGATVDEMYIQKTSLAADKPKILHFGSGYNRTAKPFCSASLGAGSGGGGTTIPAVVNARYNTPTVVFSTEKAAHTYLAQSAVPTGRMQDLTVSKVKTSVVGPSLAFLMVQRNDNKDALKRRSVSPNFLTTNIQRSRSPAFRNVSPTPIFRGHGPDDNGSEINKTAMFNQVLHQLEIGKDAKEGEKNLHQGTSNAGKQSRTFHLLEKGLARSEAEQEGSSTDNSGTIQPIICTVKASVYVPSQHEVHQAQQLACNQAQQLACKICRSLIADMFVHIKGEPLHPECFKCCRCGTKLKNQGYFHIEGQMYCDVHAKDAS